MNRILRTIASVALIASALSVSAQEKTIVFADWNIRSFEKGYSNQIPVPVDEYVDFIKTFNADIITFNEFETVTSRQGAEKMAEVAKELGMFGYFIESYPKGNDGFYGNVILSKWPIINTASKQMTYKNNKGDGYYQFNVDPELEQYGADQRSVGYADILVPRFCDREQDSPCRKLALRPHGCRIGENTSGFRVSRICRPCQSSISYSHDGRPEYFKGVCSPASFCRR